MAYWLRRYAALIFAVVALAAMWIFADGPLVWEWMGRPTEVYPEVAFAFFGLPAAVMAVASGGWIAWRSRASSAGRLTVTIARVISTFTLLVCVSLSGFALSAFLGQA